MCGICGVGHSTLASPDPAWCVDCGETWDPPYAIPWALHHAHHTGHACGPLGSGA